MRRPPCSWLFATLFSPACFWCRCRRRPRLKVTSAVPDTADQGVMDLVVTIGGENFGKGSKVAFFDTAGTTNPGGIVVKSVKFKDSKTLDATIDVAPDAQTELRFDIQVMSNGRTGKGTELFKVLQKVSNDLPPGSVADLHTVDVGFNTTVFSWTAPADDGFDPLSGPVALSELRVRAASCGPLDRGSLVRERLGRPVLGLLTRLVRYRRTGHKRRAAGAVARPEHRVLRHRAVQG